MSLSAPSYDGLSLVGRRMVYPAWPTDEAGLYRQPTPTEIELTWGGAGAAVAETLVYFEECGGSMRCIVSLLNELALDECFCISRYTLRDPARWSSCVYYFYFIIIAKEVNSWFDSYFRQVSMKTTYSLSLL